jgi:hypothetical protein
VLISGLPASVTALITSAARADVRRRTSANSSQVSSASSRPETAFCVAASSPGRSMSSPRPLAANTKGTASSCAPGAK